MAVPGECVHVARLGEGQTENIQAPMAVQEPQQGKAWPVPALWFPVLWHLVVSGAVEEAAGECGVEALEQWVEVLGLWAEVLGWQAGVVERGEQVEAGGAEEMAEQDGAQDEAEDEQLAGLGECKDGYLYQGQHEKEEAALEVVVQVVEAGAGGLGVAEEIACGEVEGGLGVEAPEGYLE